MLNLFLSLVAIAVAVLGVLSLSQATQGVGLIGLACFIGILTRIGQAGMHREQQHKEAVAALAAAQPVPQPPPPAASDADAPR